MKRALIVCPGRGSYNATELGYLRRPGRSALPELIATADAVRAEMGFPTISSLDAAPRFDPRTHLSTKHASALICACSVVDASLISDEYEIVAVAGNSMGWYTALCVSGSLEFEDTFRLIQTMSGLQDEHSVGGQLIYPLTDEQWHPDAEAASAVDRVLAEINGESEPIAYWSIRLGGYAVLAGTDEGVAALMDRLPPIQRGGRQYPMILQGHAAYHTPLLAATSDRAVERFGELNIRPPVVPLIDGRGNVYRPLMADPAELYRYTFVQQVTRTYDFTHSIRVGLREYGPDCIILLGPGEQLGGAIGQIIVGDQWLGIDSRDAFSARQASDPCLLSMGRADQFARVTAAAPVEA